MDARVEVSVQMVFSVLILGERINRRVLVLIVAGTMLMLLRTSEKPFSEHVRAIH